MALPSSPPIDLVAVCNEFGAPTNTPLTSFLRGGAWVPDTPANAGVPTALPISLLDLLGASAIDPLSMSLTPSSASDTHFEPEPAPSTMVLTTNTVTASAIGGSGAVSYLWEYVSGSTAFGTASSTASTRSWTATVNKNIPAEAVWRCTVTKGSDSVNQLLNVTAYYNTDL